MNVSSVPSKFLSRSLITTVVLVVMMVATSVCILVLVFLRLKKIRENIDREDDHSNGDSVAPPSVVPLSSLSEDKGHITEEQKHSLDTSDTGVILDKKEKPTLKNNCSDNDRNSHSPNQTNEKSNTDVKSSQGESFYAGVDERRKRGSD